MCRGVEKQSVVMPCSLQMLLSTSWRTLSSNRKLPVACSEKYLQTPSSPIASVSLYFHNLVSWASSGPENHPFQNVAQNVTYYYYYYYHFTAMVSRWSWVSILLLHLFRKWTSGISGMGLCRLDVLPATQPSVSKHWSKHKALTLDFSNTIFAGPITIRYHYDLSNSLFFSIILKGNTNCPTQWVSRLLGLKTTL